jgi:ribulose-5-phosphate 4-epimerase/fuculose-1-phosphate aldolase
MALTGRLIANVYAINGNPVDRTGGTVNGRINYFPNQGTQFYTAPSGTSFNGVTCNSVISVYPTGLKVNPDLYYCVESIATLVTNGS